MSIVTWPQWLGATEMGRAIATGNAHLVDALGLPATLMLTTSVHGDPATQQGIVGRSELLSAMEHANRLLDTAQNVLLVGGDCATDIAPIAIANRRSDGLLKLIYFDAHADINIPAMSASGALHGMVLGHLLGHGDSDILRIIGKGVLRVDQIQYRGVRVYDDYERDEVARLGIDTQPIEADPGSGDSPLYLHIDLDVLDPNSFPFTTWPAEGGPTVAELARAVELLVDTGRVVGIAVTECAAPTAADAQLLEPLLSVLRRWHATTAEIAH